MTLQEIALFTPAECASLSEEVLKMDPFLVDRGDMYTLGANIEREDPKAYPAIANACNVIIGNAFSVMYERLSKALGEALGEPVGYLSSGLGLPTFILAERRDRPLRLWFRNYTPEALGLEGLEALEGHSPFTFVVPVTIPTTPSGWGEETIKQFELGEMVLVGTPANYFAVGCPEGLPNEETLILLAGRGITTNKGIVIYA
tara:strand:+ start:6871 stop:7476 length:606 start_codon:yes stop_codon:yes gene_type:complete